MEPFEIVDKLGRKIKLTKERIWAHNYGREAEYLVR